MDTLTLDELLKLPAGPELDSHVYQNIAFKHDSQAEILRMLVPRYSQSVDCAFDLVEILGTDNFILIQSWDHPGKWLAGWHDNNYVSEWSVDIGMDWTMVPSETIPLAICRAALRKRLSHVQYRR